MISPLTFDLLEDVMELPQDECNQVLAKTEIEDIGPLVETLYSNYDEATNHLQRLLPSPETEALYRILRDANFDQPQQDLAVIAHKIEFARAPQTKEQFGSRFWQAYCMRMQSAAKSAGLDLGFAQGLVASLDEMASNAVEHSEQPGTTMVGYKWSDSGFEYVIADSGIGVLRSLQLAAEYKSVADAGEALDIAIQSGESRYGKGSGRGLGFDKLVVNIARRNSRLRFRSGDYSLTLDGLSPPVTKTIRSCSDFEGFLISIKCFLSH